MSFLAGFMLLIIVLLGGFRVYTADSPVEALPPTLYTVGRILAMLICPASLAVGVYLAFVLQYNLLPTEGQREQHLRYPDGSAIVHGAIIIGYEMLLWWIFQLLR